MPTAVFYYGIFLVARLAAALFILPARFYARLREALGLIRGVIHSMPFIPSPSLFILFQGQIEQGQNTESEGSGGLQTRPPHPPPPGKAASPRPNKRAPILSSYGSLHRRLPALSPAEAAADCFGVFSAHGQRAAAFCLSKTFRFT